MDRFQRNKWVVLVETHFERLLSVFQVKFTHSNYIFCFANWIMAKREVCKYVIHVLPHLFFLASHSVNASWLPWQSESSRGLMYRPILHQSTNYGPTILRVLSNESNNGRASEDKLDSAGNNRTETLA